MNINQFNMKFMRARKQKTISSSNEYKNISISVSLTQQNVRNFGHRPAKVLCN